MSERKFGKAIFGAVIGLVLGIFLGANRVAELAADHEEVAPTGWDPAYYAHSGRFWFIVVVCTIVFAFISGRIGRPPQQSDL